jgi:predicted SnoaL-like aldol condensation-catalyzing enzyme
MKLALLTLFAIVIAGLLLAAPARESQQDRNKRLVIEFYNKIFQKHDVDSALTYLTEDYKQHNPMAATGRKPFMDIFKGYFKAFPDAYSEIKRAAADGDLVFLHVHAKQSKTDRGSAVVDIFRVKGDKIVEHWDVIQAVPEKAANSNTMF